MNATFWPPRARNGPFYGLNVGQIGANAWLYWQLAVLPGGLWQNFSSIPTFLLPQALRRRLPEVNIEGIIFTTINVIS